MAAYLFERSNGSLQLPPQPTNTTTAPIVAVPLVHLRNVDGETALLLAAETGHLKTLQFLLAQGSDVTVADTHNAQTAFHGAARAGRVWALACLHAAAVQRLGPAGAQALLNAPDAEGHTCLDWAAVNGHLPCLKLLLRLGLDPRRADPAGRCTLHLAALGRRADVSRYLVHQRGLDPQSLRDAQGQTPLAHAGGNRAVLAALRTRSAPTGAVEADQADTPTRREPTRAVLVAAYALASTAAWAAPFFFAWYWALPLLIFTSLLLSLARRQGGGGVHAHHGQQQAQLQQQAQARDSKVSPVARWVGGQEAYPGFWLGTLVAFTAADPMLRFWPQSVAWMDAGGGEMASTTAAISFPTLSGGAVAMYVLFGATVLLWADLVFWRADPGTVLFDGRAFGETLAWVAATASPPPDNHTCPTCLVRKPLRSKVRVDWEVKGKKISWPPQFH